MKKNQWLSGLFEEPALDPARRAHPQAYLAALGRPELERWVSRLDPPRARFGRAQLSLREIRSCPGTAAFPGQRPPALCEAAAARVAEVLRAHVRSFRDRVSRSIFSTADLMMA